MTQEEIIRKLFEARVCKRMSQNDLGEASGYNRSQVVRAELGQITPKLGMVCDLADALGLEIVVRPKE
jgi:transcriptional regulator with XRE-family HTH domain